MKGFVNWGQGGKTWAGKWLRPDETNEEKVVEEVILEQFLQVLRSSVQKRNPVSGQRDVEPAEEYVAA